MLMKFFSQGFYLLLNVFGHCRKLFEAKITKTKSEAKSRVDTTTGSPSVSTVGSDKVLVFNGSGSYTA